MNPQPFTRRNVVALLAYVFLGVNALSALLTCFNLTLLEKIPLLNSAAGGMSGAVPVNLLMLVVQLFFLPVVPLIAAGVGGRNANQLVTRRDVRFLILPCIGVFIAIGSLPNLITYVSYYFGYFSPQLMSSYTSASPAMTALTRTFWKLEQPTDLVFIAGALIRLFLGFALAFFPAIFSSLRHRMRDENENAAR